jgi:hypothetical protein
VKSRVSASGAGGFEFPAEREFAGDAVAGVRQGLGKQGFFGGVEALPGIGTEIGFEVAA